MGLDFLAVNVQANTWSSYESGVFPTSKCGGAKGGVAIDHVVQLVGYTPQAWIVRNRSGYLDRLLYCTYCP
jgi:hypothetical protein